jgi:hypothetical protein
VDSTQLPQKTVQSVILCIACDETSAAVKVNECQPCYVISVYSNTCANIVTLFVCSLALHTHTHARARTHTRTQHIAASVQ